VSASLSLLVLKTQQIDKLVAFYHQIGVEFVEEQHGNGPRHYSGQAGNVLLEIYPLKSAEDPADVTTRLGFSVANIEGVMNSLRRIDAEIVSAPQPTEWGIRALVRDPHGRVVELIQH
jgi:predicted enzyme related to lactoylglutathione lyase